MSKEMLNSSNYILVTYLSEMESKFILCHFCMVLANLSFKADLSSYKPPPYLFQY